jgi:hypothetical protein
MTAVLAAMMSQFIMPAAIIQVCQVNQIRFNQMRQCTVDRCLVWGVRAEPFGYLLTGLRRIGAKQHFKNRHSGPGLAE